MSNIISISGSYVQTKRHQRVSEAYKVVQAASVGQAMNSSGLQLVSLQTGRAKHEDKVDFQRTLSRYRGSEIGDGIFLDVIYDSKHMGRGVDKILLGIYRLICTNGLMAGKTFFSHGIRHNGNTYEELEEGIAAALSMKDKLSETVEKWQHTELNEEKKQFLASEAVKLLTPEFAFEVRHRLLTVNRESDRKNDLWTTYNTIQENAMSGKKIAYLLPASHTEGKNSQPRQMVTRTIKPNTAKDAEFNQALFGLAEKLAA